MSRVKNQTEISLNTLSRSALGHTQPPTSVSPEILCKSVYIPAALTKIALSLRSYASMYE